MDSSSIPSALLRFSCIAVSQNTLEGFCQSTANDFSRLDLALYKLFWDSEIDALPESSVNEIRDAVKAAGPERMILSRCDRPHAVPFGRGIGIGLFQGWRIDSALKPKTV